MFDDTSRTSESLTADAGEAAGPAPYVGLPPLRIHHLVAWTAATGLVMSFSMWFDRTMRNGPPVEDPGVLALLFVAAITVPGALCFAGYGLYWRRQGGPFPAQPGEWLLVELAAAACGVAGWFAAMFAVFLIEEDWLDGFRVLSTAGLALAFAVLNVYVAARHCDTTMWRAVFWLLAATSLGGWISWFLFSSVTAAAVAVAAWNDRRRRPARHWTHWLGAAYWAALCVAGAAAYR